MSRRMMVPLKFLTLSTDPTSGSVGEVYVNTITKNLRVHNGTTWIDLTPASTDPAPFYMHTHTYDGEVHTIDVKNPIFFTDINNEDPSTVVEELPIIDSIEGGTPTSQQDETPTLFELTLFDGGQI